MPGGNRAYRGPSGRRRRVDTPLRALVGVLALAGMLAVVAVPTAQADDISSKKHKIDQQITATQQSIEGADAQVAAAEQTLVRVHQQLPAAHRALTAARDKQISAQAAADRASADLAAAKTALAGTQAKLAQTQADYDARKAQVTAVIGAAYEQGPVTTLDAVLSQGDANTLLDRTSLLQSVLGSNNQKVVDLGNTRAAVVEQQRELAGREAAIARHTQDAQDALASKRRAVADAATQEQRIRQLGADQVYALSAAKRYAASQRNMLADLQAADAKVSAQLQAAYVTQLGSGGPTTRSGPPTTTVGRGGLLWPASGPLGQGYGGPGGHPGIDIEAPYGSPIWAAKDGTVALIWSTGQSGGYGNYTCIAHGGGFSTCYAHQSVIEVSVGQAVRQGQEIGKVGSTGYSTGPHLHFETRINGQTTDPMQFF